MSQNLALDTRPKCFGQVVGQAPVVTALINQLNYALENPNESIQANLFMGIRGVGKTTLARIAAKYLNCSTRIDKKLNEPCTCPSCTAIDNEAHPDYLELDTAKNNGVSQMEDIIQIAHAPPMYEFKVIFLDECHLLSRNAANTILKTLEEPPAHVLFLLGTTEPERLLPTIKSRCRERVLTKITPEILLQHLQEVSYAHSFSSLVDNSVLEYIAANSGGSARDAITAFSEVIDLGDNVTVEEFIEARAKVTPYEIQLILQAIARKDIAESLTLVEESLKGTTKAHELFTMLQDTVNELMLYRAGVVGYEDYIDALNLQQCLDLGQCLAKASSLCNGHINTNIVNLALVEFFTSSTAESTHATSNPPETEKLAGLDAALAIANIPTNPTPPKAESLELPPKPNKPKRTRTLKKKAAPVQPVVEDEEPDF